VRENAVPFFSQKAQVQVMVEGPGHVPIHHVETTMLLQKQLCHQAPYFVPGTLAIDVALGYDHITAAIGGALAGLPGRISSATSHQRST
jgi:phosphomethylpyrimidine synthase